MKIKKTFFYALISSIIGFICIILPPYVIDGEKLIKYNSPLFPFITTAIENIHIITSASLMILIYGCLGYFAEIKWFIIWPSAIILFPLALCLEIILSPTSHNLWPFELFLYAFLGLPAVIGAFIGNRISRQKKMAAPDHIP